MSRSDYDFSGVWRSSYKVANEAGGPAKETEHYVTMHKRGKYLILESLPTTNGSYLWAKFTLDGRIATGTYHSQNSPHSTHKGAIYYGAAQMVLDLDGRALRGKGVGFGKDLEVKISHWQLEHVGSPEADRQSAKALATASS